MKNLLFLLVLFSASAFAQTTITASKVNGTCVLLGTMTQALNCANGNGVIEVPSLTPIPALTTNATIPAGVTLQFDGGASCITTTGFTLAINGALVAPDNEQLFCGSGTVTGLHEVRPEWFGGQVINTQVMNALNNGGVLRLRNATYTNTFGPNGICWTQPNVWFKGSGEPIANAGFTGLTGGTIIQGSFGFSGTNNVTITDLGVDNGSAVNGGASTADGLVVTGATGCISSNPADPLVTGTYIANVSTMLSGAVSFHALRVEHNTGAVLRNVMPYFGLHGLTMKSVDSSVTGLRAYGQSGDALIMKSDAYTTVGNINITDMKAGPAGGNILQTGIIIDSENNVQVSGISISNVQIVNANNGLQMISNGTFGPGAITAIGLSRFTYITNNSTGLAQSQCLESSGSGTGTITWFHSSGVSCLNSTGLNSIPINFAFPVNNSELENTQTAGANTSTGNQLTGTGLVINNFTETDNTATKPFTLTANTAVTITGYQGPNPLSASTLNAGASITPTTGPYPVAFVSLPTCTAALEGTSRAVNNSNTAVFNAAVAGGGANHIVAYCNGTAWVAH